MKPYVVTDGGFGLVVMAESEEEALLRAARQQFGIHEATQEELDFYRN